MVNSSTVYGIDAYPAGIEAWVKSAQYPPLPLRRGSGQATTGPLRTGRGQGEPFDGFDKLTASWLPPSRNRYGGQAGASTMTASIPW